MKEMKKILFGLTLIILLMSFVSAVKPEPQIISNGCEIRLPQATTLKQDQNVDVNIHVVNTTIGSHNHLVNDVTTLCFIHLYNASGHTLERNMTLHTNGLEWHTNILGSNFSELGEFAYYIECEAPDVLCAVSGAYQVTSTGQLQTTGEGIASFSFLILMLFLTGLFIYGGFKLSDTEELWVLGIFLFFLALIFIIYDVWLGYEYQLKYVGAAASSAVPMILFYMFLLIISAGLLTAGILLFKRIPEIVKRIKMGKQFDFNEGEDGWDGKK